MSRKKTVKIIYSSVKEKIDKHFRSNVVFCEAMGFQNRNSWVSDLARGRNLPSPEEAARMCVLLQTTPEEILVEQADIDLVNGLLEQEREKSAKKERPADGEALTDMQKTAIDFVKSMSDADLKLFLDILKTVRENSKRSE